MFFASLEGLPYDPRWANHYKPYGYEFNGTPASQSTPSSAPAATESPKVESTPDPVPAKTESKGTEDNTKSVLEQLRQRTAKPNG